MCKYIPIYIHIYIYIYYTHIYNSNSISNHIYLGYSSYAELSLSKKMAPDVDSVLSLIDMLLVKAKPIAEKEVDEVKQFAHKNGTV